MKWLALFAFLSQYAAASLPKLPQQLSVKTVAQKDLLIANSSDQRSVFVFVSARCPCSRSYRKVINKLADEYQNQGISFYGIHSNVEENLERDRKFLEEKYLFPIIDDSEQKLLDLFKAFKTPHAYILDGSQVVYHGGIGSSRIHKSDAQPLLENALKQETPNPAETKTMGCFIQRKKI